MNQLFVAKYTSSHNGVKADVIILLQSIEGDLGVLTHRILLTKCLGLVPQTQTSKAVAPLGRLPVQSRVISIHLQRWSAHFEAELHVHCTHFLSQCNESHYSFFIERTQSIFGNIIHCFCNRGVSRRQN